MCAKIQMLLFFRTWNKASQRKIRYTLYDKGTHAGQALKKWVLYAIKIRYREMAQNDGIMIRVQKDGRKPSIKILYI